MTELRFTETMEGYVGLGEQDCQRGYEEGRRSGTPLFMRLHLVTPDLDAFLRSRDRLLNVQGEIAYAPLGEELPTSGTVNQLIDVEGDPRRKSMPYRLQFTDSEGRRLVLSAIKNVVDDAGFDAWRDTTTLNVHILAEDGSTTIAAGILHISLPAFLRQFPSYRLSGGSVLQRVFAFPRFYGAFLAKLWEVYGPRRRASP